MAFYAEEDQVWKCAQHPSRRRRSGVCHLCLQDRLSALCPDCSNVRPCPCSLSSSSTSSSSSSSFSLHFSETGAVIPGGSFGRISTMIESEPPFPRSRSSAFPFFRSARFSAVPMSDAAEDSVVLGRNSSSSSLSSSFWAVFWGKSKGRGDKMDGEMKRSKSLAASVRSESMAVPTKSKGWYFPSPMKVFRQSKASKVAQERSPLHRG